MCQTSSAIAIKPTRVVAVITTTREETTRINLYHAPNWKERLLGRWVLNGDTLTFQEGELINAIRAGKPIEIHNGAWDNPTFERFWQQALTCGVRHGNQIIHIPESITLTRPETDAYEWHSRPRILPGLSQDETVYVLNPSSLGGFFERYELEGDQLIKKPSWLQAHANEHCIVNVTRTLSEDAWAMLLDECARHQVILDVHAAPGVTFPAAFTQQPVIQTSSPIEALDTLTHGLIISTDIDTSVAMLVRQNDAPVVIDVSECTPSDLLIQLNGHLNQDSLRFEFSQSNSALTCALSENQKIILKGHFSPELMDALAPLLLQEKTKKQLLLVTHDSNAGAFIANRYQHVVSIEDKRSCLPSDLKTTDEWQINLETEPLSRIKARYTILKANPKASSDDAWLGMHSLPQNTETSTVRLHKPLRAVECATATKARIAKVNAILDLEPYVFLTGLSGVGKSTFVEKELCQHDALYLTEERIEAWANDTSDQRKILFIDEANLSPRQWSEFEGLYNTPPGILVHGKLYPLSPKHKVVFAGNPVNYGDERTLAPFFTRHGNAVLFTPLSSAVIYEKILKPVFNNTSIELDLIADRILEVYGFICQCSTTDVLISPRELQMMALLIITRATDHSEQNLDDIAAHFTYTLAKNLVPKAKRAEFDHRFKPKHSIIPKHTQANTEHTFLITPSREALSQQIHDLLSLRHWRRAHEPQWNTPQKGGGLGGLIIEGEPGIGKSELVIATLRARGYEEEHDLTQPTTKDNPFYRMPVSMPLREKEALLIKAFNEGAVVIIDEINSSPMMERLLNDLLMGKNSKGKAVDHVKPGFMVLATQNPVTMAGRRVASTALLRRCITDELQEFESAELHSILLFKGVPLIEAHAMIEAYESNRAYAIKHQLSPVPNFRHLMTLAEDHLTAHATHPAVKTANRVHTQSIKEELLKLKPTNDDLNPSLPSVGHRGT